MKKTLWSILLGMIVVSCTPPVRNYLEKQPGNTPTVDSTAIDSGSVQTDSVEAPEALPPQPPAVIEIESWPGERFVLREKPPLYCDYGYDLYTCPKLESCSGPIDTAVETNNRRVRCGRLADTALTVVSVEPRGAEWLVALREGDGGRTFYARTVAGELPEFSFAGDLDGAKKRWVGTTVYSSRGFILTLDSGTIATVKVKVQEPLKVNNVRFGMTPLPAKPFWLMVETRKGRKGAIPFYYSWTNVKKALRHDGNAWDDDVFESDPSVACHADSATWETINMHHVRQGMTRDQVRLSWGRPVRKDTGGYRGAERECWVYENQRLWFDEKELVGIEEAGVKGK
jgi:hypothetical protein